MSGAGTRRRPEILALKVNLLIRLSLQKATLQRRLAGLRSMNVTATDSILGEADVTVSLTTHGRRLEQVFYAIEAIGRGSVRPRRIVLWLDDGSPEELPDSLLRLQRRGLRVDRAQNYGPHTKYYPYVISRAQHTTPLVTADDDILYERDWLARLVKARSSAARSDRVTPAHRARRITFRGNSLAPYGSWDFLIGTEPSVLNFATGVGGVLYEPYLLDALREAGDGFRGRCDGADDVWLHAVALRNGFRTTQVRTMARHPPVVPDAVAQALWPGNVGGGGNDRAIEATYEPEDLALLLAARDRELNAAMS